MTTPLSPNNSDVLAAEIGALLDLLANTPSNSPVGRYIEYRAYNELVAVLGATSGLPPDYQVFVPEANALGDWLTKGKKLSKSFKDEIQRLVEWMATSGSDASDGLCVLYCNYKTAIALGIDGAGILFQIKGALGALIAAKAAFLLIAGLPVTVLIAYLLKSKALDKLCKCPPPPATPKREPRKASKRKGRPGH